MVEKPLFSELKGKKGGVERGGGGQGVKHSKCKQPLQIPTKFHSTDAGQW